MPLTEDGVTIALELLNSWDELVDPPELLRDAETLRRWLSSHGFDAGSITEEDVPKARELRARLTAPFDARSEAEAVDLLNDLLAELGTPPRLERSSAGWRLRCWPREDGLRAVGALGAFALLEAIRDLGWERFGRCEGAPCRCLYVDRSRNRSRRYCCRLCADRIAQARHRSRKRSAATP